MRFLVAPSCVELADLHVDALSGGKDSAADVLSEGDPELDFYGVETRPERCEAVHAEPGVPFRPFLHLWGWWVAYRAQVSLWMGAVGLEGEHQDLLVPMVLLDRARVG